MKASIVALNLVGASLVATPAAAADVDTVLTACVGHPVDSNRPTEVTQLARVTLPWLPEGASFPTTMLTIQDAFRNVGIKHHGGYWKEQCYRGDSVEKLRELLERAEGLSNYPLSKKRELSYDEIWPEMIQWMKGLMPTHRWVTSSMFVAEVVGSMFTKSDNELSEAKDKERRESEARAKIPSTKVIITAGEGSAPSKPKMTSAEADAKYEADLEKYKAAMAEHDAAVDRYNKGMEAMDASKADKAQAAQQANAAYQAELAKAEAAKAEYERQRQAYREEYRRLTGRYPDE